VPARWLARLDAFLKLHNVDLPADAAAGWARALDRPAGQARPVTPPRPAPDIRHRPRSLRVTEVETWLTDPFAIYARHVLRLRKLDPLDQITDVTDYGTLVHDGMHRFLRAHGIARGPDSVRLLAEAMQTEMAKLKLRDSLQAFWAPRLARIAAWAIAAEREAPAFTAISSEVSGKWQLSDHNFELRGRADRIERRADGLAIVDYKTGTPPGVTAVNDGRAPQLPLEAAMAAAGAFGPEWRGPIAALTYWHLTGRTTPGEMRDILKGKPQDIADLVERSVDGLHTLIAAYDDPSQPYLAQPFPGAAPRYSDYAQLARVAEWSSGNGGEE